MKDMRISRFLVLIPAILLLGAVARPSTADPERRVILPGHLVPVYGTPVWPKADADQMRLAIELPLRNQAALHSLLTRLYDPNDPLYGHYLSPAQFIDRFSPSISDYGSVVAFARRSGLSIIHTYPNRTLVDVTGPASAVESAFGVRLNNFRASDGRIFYKPDREPTIPASVAVVAGGVVGLQSASVWRPQIVRRNATSLLFGANGIGSGPIGGLTPTDIYTAYSLSSTGLNGNGQTLGLFELDGYAASDIAAYEGFFNLPAVPLNNVLVDSANGVAGTNADEVTLDIELQMALAPQASAIVVYEAPLTSQGVVDLYTRIATDDIAKEISSSWGLPELEADASTLNSENNAFEQMAVQGQSIFVAAGDQGAYADGQTISVNDPGTQPFVVDVGGTSLTTNGPGGAWSSETTWGGQEPNAGGGGGISQVWSSPSYQSGAVAPGSLGSTTMRDVPDVSLDADPATGYAIFYDGGWNVYGGTSAAAPLWAAFTAEVNQARQSNKLSPIGFANPAIYKVGLSSNYTLDFHDIADGSTNLFYPAVRGYDEATGWGTFIGLNLLQDLEGTPVSGVPIGDYLTATAGNTVVKLSWGALSDATSYNLYRGTSSGGESKTPVASGITTTTYTDTHVTNGLDYFYYLVAVNAVGDGAPSNEVEVTPTVPAVPISVITLHAFNGESDGGSPWAGVTIGADGNLYGTSSGEGTLGYGTIYQVNLTNGAFTPIYTFKNGSDSGGPLGGLFQSSNGRLYGTSSGTYEQSAGTIFDLTFTGALSTLYTFKGGADGANPFSTLYQASDGSFLGTADKGGTAGLGDVYRVSPSGVFSTVYSFHGATDGESPYGGVVQDRSGTIYGVTFQGGADGYGTVYSITPNGNETTLHMFTGGDDGGNPWANLIFGSDGNLYGTTTGDYTNSSYGTIFKMTPGGAFTTLYQFTGGDDGNSPYAGLVQANDGNFYGTTFFGGMDESGTIFRIASNGAFKSIYSFHGQTDGSSPLMGSLVQDSAGHLYGTTYATGKYGYGTVYELNATVTKPPHAPTDLTVVAGNKEVGLSWQSSAGASSYNVYQATASGAEGSIPAYTNILTTSDIVTGLTNGVTYYFTVTALGASAGESAFSNEVSAAPSIQLPGAPSGVTAQPGNMAVGLSWSYLAGSSSSFTFNVYRSTASGAESTIPIASGLTTTSYLDTGLTNGMTYYYEVRALSILGTSDASAEVDATPSAADAPTVTLIGVDKATGGNWTGIYGVDGYDVIGGSAQAAPYAALPGFGGQLNYVVKSPAPSATDFALQTAPFSTKYSGSLNYVPIGKTATIDVTVTGKVAEVVSVYCLDYGNAIKPLRFETVQAADGLTGANIGSPVTLSNFALGAYVSFRVLGHVVFKIGCTTGPNAVYSGVFYGGGLPDATTLSAVAGNNEATLSWTSVPNAAGYNVYRSSVSLGGQTFPGPFTKLNSTAVTTLQFVDSTAVNGHTYYYRVTAIRSKYEGPSSNQAAVILPP